MQTKGLTTVSLLSAKKKYLLSYRCEMFLCNMWRIMDASCGYCIGYHKNQNPTVLPRHSGQAAVNSLECASKSNKNKSKTENFETWHMVDVSMFSKFNKNDLFIISITGERSRTARDFTKRRASAYLQSTQSPHLISFQMLREISLAQTSCTG